MTVADAERVVRVAGATLVCVAWVIAAVGAARARDRPTGSALGVARARGARVAYLLAGVPYALVCIALWRPLPIEPSDATRIACLVVGTIMGAAGFGLYLWGRLALGDMYNISSSLGSELFADHRLVVSGPYRFVRHPMYLGIVLGVLGALLIYRTWATVFMVLMLPGLGVKARHEDRLLAEQLDGTFEDYRARVRAWVPRRPRGEERASAARPGGPGPTARGSDPHGPHVMGGG